MALAAEVLLGHRPGLRGLKDENLRPLCISLHKRNGGKITLSARQNAAPPGVTHTTCHGPEIEIAFPYACMRANKVIGPTVSLDSPGSPAKSLCVAWAGVRVRNSMGRNCQTISCGNAAFATPQVFQQSWLHFLQRSFPSRRKPKPENIVASFFCLSGCSGADMQMDLGRVFQHQATEQKNESTIFWSVAALDKGSFSTSMRASCFTSSIPTMRASDENILEVSASILELALLSRIFSHLFKAFSVCHSALYVFSCMLRRCAKVSASHQPVSASHPPVFASPLLHFQPYHGLS